MIITTTAMHLGVQLELRPAGGGLGGVGELQRAQVKVWMMVAEGAGGGGGGGGW